MIILTKDFRLVYDKRTGIIIDKAVKAGVTYVPSTRAYAEFNVYEDMGAFIIKNKLQEDEYQE